MMCPQEYLPLELWGTHCCCPLLAIAILATVLTGSGVRLSTPSTHTHAQHTYTRTAHIHTHSTHTHAQHTYTRTAHIHTDPVCVVVCVYCVLCVLLCLCFVCVGISPFLYRRGSNVSLTLDMCPLGCGEAGASSPGEQDARQYLESASRLLTPHELHQRAINTAALHAEFLEIPMNFTDPKEFDIPGFGLKNRYKTILPNPHSRVQLITESEDPLSSYINANYIRGYGGEERVYIATQGPTVSTVCDFWRLVWQERCSIVVMITNLEEKNEKCTVYWPARQGLYGGVEVTVTQELCEEDYSLRLLTLRAGGEERCMRHYWYTSWPDQKTPDNARPLLQLVQEVEAARQQARGAATASHSPLIVHCSAGIGRTGCFIATSICYMELRNAAVVDILRTACQLRLDRGGMIQTVEQYQFVHHALSLCERRLAERAEE
uniref:protein-tyrosine-phosphatase n=1 Tax=Callorhinchus milii TaxID=7868 RepID=A0A4W3GF73_CALMI